MKKLLAMLLAATMLLCLVACSDKNDNDKNDLKDYEVEEIIITYVVTENGDTFHFESVDSETVAITKYEGPDTPHAVEIPAVLNEKKVAIVPGTAFGASGEGFARVSYAYSVNHITTAIEKIGEFIKTL